MNKSATRRESQPFFDILKKKKLMLLNSSSRLLLIIGLVLLTTNCKIADLRTKSVVASEQLELARQLILEMGEAHGIENWKKVQTYSVLLQDQFFGFFGKNSHPYQSDSVALQLDYIPGTFDGRITVLSGKKEGVVWGMQSWKTYEKLPGESLVFEKNKDSEFWVPTYQYFLEFPMRIQRATAFTYAGDAIIDGIPCKGVLASWNQVAPQKDIDQYLIWISKANKKMVKLEYTIRDQFKFLKGAVYYKDYQFFDGIWMPTYLPVESNLTKKEWLHEMRITSLKFNQVAISELRPDENLPVLGDSKSD